MPPLQKAARRTRTGASSAYAPIWAANRVLIVAMALLLLAYLIITATVPPFRTSQ